MRDEILSHEEIARLLERNKNNPDIGRPVYVAWSNNKGSCFTQSQLNESLRKAGSPRAPANLQAWEARLNSATFRVQDAGRKEARTVMRPIKTKTGWTEVPLNGRI